MKPENILFRAISHFSLKWIYGFYSVDVLDRPIIERRCFDGTKYKIECDFIDPATLGIYINRKDISGKDAFTGDIIERWHEDAMGRSHKIRGVVFYDESRLEYRIKEISGYGFTQRSLWIGHDFKIIGNMYDNPELLK